MQRKLCRGSFCVYWFSPLSHMEKVLRVVSTVKQKLLMFSGPLICFKLLVHILHSLSRNSPVRFFLAQKLQQLGLMSLGYQLPCCAASEYYSCTWESCGLVESSHKTNMILQPQQNIYRYLLARHRSSCWLAWYLQIASR